MEIAIIVATEKDRSSIELWVHQNRHQTIMLKDASRLNDYLTLRRVQIVIADNRLISFEQLRQWRERIPEIAWIAVTDEPSFAWAQEAMLAGAIGFCALPMTPAHMDTIFDLVKKQLHYHLQAMLGTEEGTSSIDLSRPIESALEYITQHLSERLTLRSVSREVYLSPSHFSRLFVQKVGLHFNDYVLARRIETAKTLLTETGLPIELIAMKTGFCSAPYFSQTFKRLTGKTPRTYRYTSSASAEPARQA